MKFSHSLWKNRQICRPTHVLTKSINKMCHGKSCPIIWAIFKIFKNPHKVNNRPISENSPNLVTLIKSHLVTTYIYTGPTVDIAFESKELCQRFSSIKKFCSCWQKQFSCLLHNSELHNNLTTIAIAMSYICCNAFKLMFCVISGYLIKVHYCVSERPPSNWQKWLSWFVGKSGIVKRNPWANSIAQVFPPSQIFQGSCNVLKLLFIYKVGKAVYNSRMETKVCKTHSLT
jgi:hypothetical protein